MIVIAAVLIGVTLGALQAKRRKGSRTDMLHWATIYGIVFLLAGLILTIIVERAAL